MSAQTIAGPEARTAVPEAPPTEWVLGAAAAAKIIQTEPVIVLDTRGARAFARGHVDGAIRVDWTTFAQREEPNRGKLLPRVELQAALRELGIRADRRVIVVGSPPDDWGEDGRVVWMLRFAGHPSAAIVDGGIAALRAVGLGKSTSKTSKTSPSRGDFVVRWQTHLQAVRDDLLGSGVVLIDTRTSREYRGATPYGESRGGHPPGAVNLHFKELMSADGTIASAEAVRRRLKELGATSDSQIIAYCTGGVRSGWLVAVLQAAGFANARNYAGSMWDWAAAPDARYPLERE